MRMIAGAEEIMLILILHLERAGHYPYEAAAKNAFVQRFTEVTGSTLGSIPRPFM
jgi:hypothetical protein